MSRKRTHRKVYRLVNPISMAIAGAAITSTADLDKVRMCELTAIEAFSTGRATKQEWMDMADLINVAETFAREGVGPEVLEACALAQEALSAAHQRYIQSGEMTLTEQELSALRDCYELHDLQRTSVSRSRYEQAIKRTSDRIRSAHPSVKVCMA